MDLLALCSVKVEALGVGVGRRWGRVNYAAGSFILVFWDGEAWIFFFSSLECLIVLVELNKPGDWSWFTSNQSWNSAFFRLLRSNCVFNNCSFFSLGHRIEVLMWTLNCTFLVTILEWCTFLMSVILVQSIAVGCFFFLKEKMAWKTFFKDLQIPNIKYVNTLCLGLIHFSFSLGLIHFLSPLPPLFLSCPLFYVCTIYHILYWFVIFDQGIPNTIMFSLDFSISFFMVTVSDTTD